MWTIIKEKYTNLIDDVLKINFDCMLYVLVTYIYISLFLGKLRKSVSLLLNVKLSIHDCTLFEGMWLALYFKLKKIFNFAAFFASVSSNW